jgi:pilus assembly protein Flp/PilA
MKVMDQLYRLRIWRDTQGQDLVEYSLLTGFIAVAAGAAFPPISNNISIIFSKISSLAQQAGG